MGRGRRRREAAGLWVFFCGFINKGGREGDFGRRYGCVKGMKVLSLFSERGRGERETLFKDF